MDNKLSFISLILTVFFIGIYLSREFTHSQYIDKLNEIKTVKDSLDKEVKNFEIQLKIRDTLLVKSISQSKEIIKEIEKKITISEKAYNEYEKNSQSIINDLVKLSNN